MIVLFTSFAREGGDLATAATNPVGSATQLRLQNVHATATHDADGSSNTFIIQPIINIDLPEASCFDNVATRITIPYVSTAEVGGEDASAWGDATALFIPTRTSQGTVAGKFFTWGPIAAVGVQTASDDMTGANVRGLGPGVALLKNDVFADGNSLVCGTLAWHLWDVEGNADVNNTNVIPVSSSSS